jgi:TolB-like protein
MPDAEKIQTQLQRILSHPEFLATDQQRAFLQFVVSETIEGRADDIKGYTVATCVFGRKADFDPSFDPVVSVQAHKLRRALERYYLLDGKQDPIRIDIPKGRYVPTFCEQAVTESDGTPKSKQQSETGFEESWPSVLIRPFQNLTGDSELNYLSIGLAIELATEITRYRDIRVLMQGPEGHGRRVSDSSARFAIDGSVRKDSAGIRVAVNLIDTSAHTQIWSDMHASDLKAAQLFAFQEHVARVVVAKIAGETGIIARALSVESKNTPPHDIKTYEAMLRYYEFNLDFSEKTFLSAYEALKLATSKEPDCGRAWSMLGRLYANNYSMELFDIETPLEEALAYAERGAKLDPANQRVRLILAYVLLFKNELTAGLAEADRSLALNPSSLILLDNIGYMMTLFGDWKRGPAMIRKAIELNPYYSPICHYALWLDWVRKGEYEQAYLETLNFRSPVLFWEPLMKAAVLGLLGKSAEGRQAVHDLLTLKPDFPSRGGILIRHYIKFENIVERVLEGLNKVGLRIE